MTGNAYDRKATSSAPSYGYPDRLAKQLVEVGANVREITVMNSGRGLIDFDLPQTDGRFQSSLSLDEEGRVDEYTIRFPELDQTGRSKFGVNGEHLTVVENAEKGNFPRDIRTDIHHGDFAPHVEAVIEDENDRPGYSEFGTFVGALIEEYDRVGPDPDEVRMP